MDLVRWWDIEHGRLGVGGFVLLMSTAGLVSAGARLVTFGIVLGAIAIWFASTAGRWDAALLGLTAWAFCTGFGVNELGQLSFTGPDLLRLTTYVGAAVVVARHPIPAQ